MKKVFDILGFLSPDGVFYKCDFYGHMELASRLLNEIYNRESNTPVDTLCRCGWVVIQDSFVGFSGDEIYHVPQLTIEQKKYLENKADEMSIAQRIGLKMCLEINEILYG